MGILDRLTPDRGYRDTIALLTESIADLSLRAEDQGWKRISGDDGTEFTRDALHTIAQDARGIAVAHPLVRRGLSLRAAYIHGNGGPQVTVDDSDSKQDVAGVVQAWWDARENQAAITGPAARARLQRSLDTDGNVFIAAFTNPRDGRVALRTIPFDEITDIITNPEDRLEPRFYRRTYTVQGQTRTVLYPDLAYSPARRPAMIDGHEVRWGEPIRHVKVNELDGWRFGISTIYSIISWARAYRDFLGDWIKLHRSLSQFAWRATADGRRAAKARQALQRAATSPANTTGAGASMVLGTGESLEAIPKSGATIDADSGRPILAMIAAGLDVPITMLSTDPGVTGARATAETLDEPMYLAMQAVRDVWAAAYRDLAGYAIEQSIRAPEGPLKGEINRDDWTSTDAAVLDGVTPTVTVSWPDLSTTSLLDLVRAVQIADATGKLPPRTIAHLLLTALGVDDIEDVLKELTDDDGQWRDPYASAGQRLADAFANGDDPAAALAQYGRFQGDTKAAEATVRG